uniref:Uncharacterized protein n=1 Tax=Timema cristinae TaxID=61476 RepID=A0A7R9CF47_TIMCR|nr:unnamed protein product [Timema cristinae]
MEPPSKALDTTTINLKVQKDVPQVQKDTFNSRRVRRLLANTLIVLSSTAEDGEIEVRISLYISKPIFARLLMRAISHRGQRYVTTQPVSSSLQGQPSHQSVSTRCFQNTMLRLSFDECRYRSEGEGISDIFTLGGAVKQREYIDLYNASLLQPLATPSWVRPSASLLQPLATPSWVGTGASLLQPLATPSWVGTSAPLLEPLATPSWVRPSASLLQPLATPSWVGTGASLLQPLATPSWVGTSAPLLEPLATPSWVRPSASLLQPLATPSWVGPSASLLQPLATPSWVGTGASLLQPLATPSWVRTSASLLQPLATPSWVRTSAPLLEPLATLSWVGPRASLLQPLATPSWVGTGASLLQPLATPSWVRTSASLLQPLATPSWIRTSAFLLQLLATLSWVRTSASLLQPLATPSWIRPSAFLLQLLATLSWNLWLPSAGLDLEPLSYNLWLPPAGLELVPLSYKLWLPPAGLELVPLSYNLWLPPAGLSLFPSSSRHRSLGLPRRRVFFGIPSIIAVGIVSSGTRSANFDVIDSKCFTWKIPVLSYPTTECPVAPFVSGSLVQRIPFVFLPLKEQIINPSAEISFAGSAGLLTTFEMKAEREYNLKHSIEVVPEKIQSQTNVWPCGLTTIDTVSLNEVAALSVNRPLGIVVSAPGYKSRGSGFGSRLVPVSQRSPEFAVELIGGDFSLRFKCLGFGSYEHLKNGFTLRGLCADRAPAVSYRNHGLTVLVTKICAVSSAQFLARDGWTDLHNNSHSEPLFHLFLCFSTKFLITGVTTPICAVSSAQFLARDGWTDLHNNSHSEPPFRLFRDEGKTYLMRLSANGRKFVLRRGHNSPAGILMLRRPSSHWVEAASSFIT